MSATIGMLSVNMCLGLLGTIPTLLKQKLHAQAMLCSGRVRACCYAVLLLLSWQTLRFPRLVLNSVVPVLCRCLVTLVGATLLCLITVTSCLVLSALLRLSVWTKFLTLLGLRCRNLLWSTACSACVETGWLLGLRRLVGVGLKPLMSVQSALGWSGVTVTLM